MVDAILLAGGKSKGHLLEYTGVENKALLKIKDKPMVEYVLEALKSSELVGKIVVIGPEKELKGSLERKADEILEQGDSVIENVLRGIKALSAKDNLLIVTSDIPLISKEMIDDFILQCEKTKADIYYPIIEKRYNQEKYPQVKRTYMRLREGIFTGGNLLLVNPLVFTANLSLYNQVFQLRKSPLRLVKILGFTFIIKLVLGRLSIPEAQERIKVILGGSWMVPIFSGFPEVGLDVDKVSDLRLVREVLEERRKDD